MVRRQLFYDKPVSTFRMELKATNRIEYAGFMSARNRDLSRHSSGLES